MRFGSVCSGIEAASVAFAPLGWSAAWLAEIEPFPAAVLAHHYPDVPNLGDMTLIARRVLTGEVSSQRMIERAPNPRFIAAMHALDAACFAPDASAPPQDWPATQAELVRWLPKVFFNP